MHTHPPYSTLIINPLTVKPRLCHVIRNSRHQHIIPSPCSIHLSRLSSSSIVAEDVSRYRFFKRPPTSFFDEYPPSLFDFALYINIKSSYRLTETLPCNPKCTPPTHNSFSLLHLLVQTILILDNSKWCPSLSILQTTFDFFLRCIPTHPIRR
jgi:hypothetical protein